jgi:hypothetical protein
MNKSVTSSVIQAQVATRAALKAKNIDPSIIYLLATRSFLRPNFLCAASTPNLEPFTSISFFRGSASLHYLCYLQLRLVVNHKL